MRGACSSSSRNVGWAAIGALSETLSFLAGLATGGVGTQLVGHVLTRRREAEAEARARAADEAEFKRRREEGLRPKDHERIRIVRDLAFALRDAAWEGALNASNHIARLDHSLSDRERIDFEGSSPELPDDGEAARAVSELDDRELYSLWHDFTSIASSVVWEILGTGNEAEADALYDRRTEQLMRRYRALTARLNWLERNR